MQKPLILLAHPTRFDRVTFAFGGRGGGFGPAPISHQDMGAFQRVSREPLRPWEVEIIRALDREYLKAASAKAVTGNPATEASTRPMSPALFDAVFR